MPTPAALQALKTLTSGAANPADDINAYLQRNDRLQEMKRNLELAQQGGGFMTGATPADVSDVEASQAEDPFFGKAAHEKVAANQKLHDFLTNPEQMQANTQEQAQKVQLAAAPAEAQAKGAVAVEQEKTKGALAEKAAQAETTQKLLQSLGGGGAAGGGGGIGGPGSTIKPTINATGGVSFTTTAMPALVQRARNQLMDARDKTLAALSEAEKLYPGINDEALKHEAGAEPTGASSWTSFLTGGSGKYNDAADMASAVNERLKYRLGMATPFSKFAQEASFGNIEQMAGQLPGVRGLATITPLFKEHQARLGQETHLSSVQRLRHMADLMDQTINTLDTSGAGAPEER